MDQLRYRGIGCTLLALVIGFRASNGFPTGTTPI